MLNQIRHAVERAVDLAIEAPVAPSFTRIGYEVRRRVEDWEPAAANLAGKRILLTGGTSGIGAAAVRQFVAAGADVVITGRSAERTNAAAVELGATAFAADMGEADQVRALADHVLEQGTRLDVLVHNAGALSDERRTNAAGTEATVASQVEGPFLLTALLLPALAESGTAEAPSRVLTMSSGGMYAAPLSVRGLEMSPASYGGSAQYATAKRAQVVLNEMWAERFADTHVRFHALHPGWADTPGVADALPGFAAILGPALRTPDQGADTLVWLAGCDDAAATSGKFWHDRRIRSIHKLPNTKSRDTPERRAALWDDLVTRTGVSPDPGALGSPQRG